MNRLIKALFLSLLSISVQAENLDTSKLNPGELKTVIWDEMPVHVYKRTDEQIEKLKNKHVIYDKKRHSSALTFRARSINNEHASKLNYGSDGLEDLPLRSKREDILVLSAMSTYYGCYIHFKPERDVFFDPCSKTEYNLDGRISNPNIRERYHLLMPPHYYEGETLILGIKDKDELPYIDFSPDFSTLDLSPDEMLLEAFEWKKYDVVQSILKKKIDINHETVTGATALFIAATRGRPDDINSLIKYGFDVNHVSKSGNTALQLALMGDHSDNIITLLRHGARTDEFCNKDRCAKSALEYLKDIASDMTEAQLMEYIDNAKPGNNETTLPRPGSP